MRRTMEQRRSAWLLGTGVALVAIAMLTGILHLVGLPGGETTDRPRPTATAGGTTEPTGPTGPTEPTEGILGESEERPAPGAVPASVVRFARTGTLLAVEVRNDSDYYLRAARLRIVARDGRGREVAQAGAPRWSCCTLLDVPSGGRYGAWASIPRDAPPVREVSVEVVDARVGRPTGTTPKVVASPGSVQREADGTVVTTSLTATGPVDGRVAAQAFLVGPRGRFVAVVSGRFWCFADGDTRTVRMQLPQTVPRGTRVDRIVARSVPASAATPIACS